MSPDIQTMEGEELSDEMGDLGLGNVHGLELVEQGPAAAESEPPRLRHQTELGVDVGLSLGRAERVPVWMEMGN